MRPYPPVAASALLGDELVAAVQAKGSVMQCCTLGVKLGSVRLIAERCVLVLKTFI